MCTEILCANFAVYWKFPRPGQNPASNGQVERYNRLISQMIRCFINKKQNNWDIHLQQLTGAIRATENRQTGFTPNVMLFGRENLQHVDLILGIKVTDASEEDMELHEYIKQMRNTIQEMSTKRQKRDYDLKSNQNTYTRGDIVFKLDIARKVGVCPKFKSHWEGPYVIVDIKSLVLYKIKDKKGIEVVHHDRLKLCQDRDVPK